MTSAGSRRRRVLTSIGTLATLALGTFCEASERADLAFQQLVRQVEHRQFTRATVLYLDPRSESIVSMTVPLFQEVACHIELGSSSPRWTDLLAALKEEKPVAGEGGMGDIRLGIVFHGAKDQTQELYFAGYIGPQESDQLQVKGVVNDSPVRFSYAMPRKVRALIRGLPCLGTTHPYPLGLP